MTISSVFTYIRDYFVTHESSHVILFPFPTCFLPLFHLIERSSSVMTMVHPTSIVSPMVKQVVVKSEERINCPPTYLLSNHEDNQPGNKKPGQKRNPSSGQFVTSVSSAARLKLRRIKRWSNRTCSRTTRIMGNILSYAFAYW